MDSVRPLTIAATAAAAPLAVQAVRDSGDTAPSVSVDVDCLTFDRVLLFLEAHLLGRSPPQWSLHLIDDLAKVWGVTMLSFMFG